MYTVAPSGAKHRPVGHDTQVASLRVEAVHVARQLWFLAEVLFETVGGVGEPKADPSAAAARLLFRAIAVGAAAPPPLRAATAAGSVVGTVVGTLPARADGNVVEAVEIPPEVLGHDGLGRPAARHVEQAARPRRQRAL